jgi:aryl-alcohol dehydrogenase-like predicted oxidoreductase
MELVPLGNSPVRVSPLGVGTVAWNTRNSKNGPSSKELEEAFHASLEAGLNLFDTAEIYGRGQSERLLGGLAHRHREKVVIATKFTPLPWRLRSGSLTRALDGSLKRLGVDYVDLYQVHFYTPFPRLLPLMDALADAVQAGKVRAVGVSNYSAAQMRHAHHALAQRGIPLASNQVAYSLWHRGPEVNGLLTACQEMNITLIAYIPLARGLLTGKYTPEHRPPGLRRFMAEFRPRNLRRAMPLIEQLKHIGQARGKTPAQVALNWLLRQPGVVPIPGVKNCQQAVENAGAVGWQLSREEEETLAEVRGA